VVRSGPGVIAALRGLLRGPDFDVVLAFTAFAALPIDPLATHQVKELSPLAAGAAVRSNDIEGVPLRPQGAGLTDLGDLIAGVSGAGLAVEQDEQERRERQTGTQRS
jgi:hypothetical protein